MNIRTVQRRNHVARLLAIQYCKQRGSGELEAGATGLFCQGDQGQSHVNLAGCAIYGPDQAHRHLQITFAEGTPHRIEKVELATDSPIEAELDPQPRWNTTRQDLVFPQDLLNAACRAIDDPKFPTCKLTSMRQVLEVGQPPVEAKVVMEFD